MTLIDNRTQWQKEKDKLVLYELELIDCTCCCLEVSWTASAEARPGRIEENQKKKCRRNYAAFCSELQSAESLKISR